MTLSADDVRLIGACLHAVANGPFIPDWELSILMGMTRAECAAVAARWPEVNLQDEDVRLSVANGLNHLVGYPIDEEDQWDRYIPVARAMRSTDCMHASRHHFRPNSRSISESFSST
jgi:hypothetical protein